MRVIRGTRNPKDVGRVVEWNNQSALTIWSSDQCNAYNGTDSTIFHPFLYKDEDVVSFSPDICRSLGARYVKPSEVQGTDSTFRVVKSFDFDARIPSGTDQTNNELFRKSGNVHDSLFPHSRAQESALTTTRPISEIRARSRRKSASAQRQTLA